MPGMGRLLVMFMVAYAVLVTVQVLWSGPYLHDVHGLDTLERGHVLLGMAVAQTVGTLLVGPMDRVLNTRKWVVGGGGVADARIAHGAGRRSRLAAALPSACCWC